MLVCSIINWQLSWGFCTISSNLLSTVHHCVCLERIFFVNGAQHSSQCGSYNLSSWLLWVELSCISTTNIIFQPCLRVSANMPDSFYVVVAVMNINLVRVISRCSRLKCCNWNLVLLMIKKQHEINLKLFSIKMKSSWVPFPTQGMRPMSSPFMLVSYWKGLGEKPPSARNPEQHTIHCTSSYLYVTQISNAAWCSKKRNAIF